MSFEKNKAKLRKRLIDEGKIDVDMTKKKICINCYYAKRLIVGCGGDAGMICKLKTEYYDNEPIFQSVDAGDTCEIFQY